MSVIRPIKPSSGWEIIPNSFAEDLRLSEDAVAVGLWLACKPGTWEVQPCVIQQTFSKRPGKPRGREWWSRVSAELKAGGYLRLSRFKDKGGKFSSDWDFCVSGLKGEIEECGSADAGSAGIGSSGAGVADFGTADVGTVSASNQHSIKQYSVNTKQKKSLLQPPQSVTSRFSRLSIEQCIVRYEQQLVQILQSEPQIDAEIAQDLLDELAGALEAGYRGERSKVGSPPSWLRQLIVRHLNGKFDQMYCLQVQARRAERIRELQRRTGDAHPRSWKSEIATNELAKAKELIQAQK